MRFDQSYGASGEQARAVEGGLPADIVALSLEPDVDKLVEAGLVAEDWKQTPSTKGIVTNSVVVFAVRKGNPKNIRTWDDLVKDGVEVITPNPFTSGGAKWNMMAAYGAQIEQGKRRAGRARLPAASCSRTSPVQDKSAREALQTFTGGKGDVLLAYENEAITAQQKGEDLDYVVPDQTILIENPVAVIKDSKPADGEGVRRLRCRAEAQKIFAEKGYRSVIAEPGRRERSTRRRPTLFEIDEVRRLGEGQRRVLRPGEGRVAEIERTWGSPLRS